MDEFMVLLVVAFVVIGAMLLIGTPLADFAEGTWPGGGTASGDGKAITSFDLGRVGTSDSEIARTVQFGSFTLGRTQSESLKEMSRLSVSKGYFGSDSKVFELGVNENVLSNLKDVKISFDMDETNLYGNLIIKWNGKTFFNRLANLNEYDVYVPAENVKDANTLEISAGDPGLYFWAATQYNVRNFKVEAEYGPEKIFSFKIFPSEVETWNKGKLKFYTTSGQEGDITVKLNGVEILREKDPEHLVVNEFDYSEIGNVMKIGDNILSFKSDQQFTIDDVEFEISIAGSTVTKERSVNVTESQLNSLRGGKGTLCFDVDNIYRPGVLSIKINDNQLNVQTVRTGENTVEFRPEDLRKGSNTIRFSGSGSWDINNVQMKINS